MKLHFFLFTLLDCVPHTRDALTSFVSTMHAQHRQFTAQPSNTRTHELSLLNWLDAIATRHYGAPRHSIDVTRRNGALCKFEPHHSSFCQFCCGHIRKFHENSANKRRNHLLRCRVHVGLSSKHHAHRQHRPKVGVELLPGVIRDVTAFFSVHKIVRTKHIGNGHESR